jgi:chemotaxis protein MotB
MARRRRPEEHGNHEAWAIPYGDLLTLLLAFFVVMYSISSVNEGKYRVLSDALSEAFGGPPKSLKPIQFGSQQQRGVDKEDRLNLLQTKSVDQSVGGTMRELRNPAVIPGPIFSHKPMQQLQSSGATGYAGTRALERIGAEIRDALGDLIDHQLITVRRTEAALEVEMRTDILFASGSAQVADSARTVLGRLAAVLQRFPNPLRIEGHTDDVPIHTAAFPSNWELSAGRAASVVHLFMDQGVAPERMTVMGFGQYRPAADNASADGRNRNRRVMIVILAEPEAGVPEALQRSEVQAGAPPPEPIPPAGVAPTPEIPRTP